MHHFCPKTDRRSFARSLVAGVLLAGGALVLLLLANHLSAGEAPKEGAKRSTLTNAERKYLVESDLVVLARIIKTGPSPRIWSGIAVSRQPVVYKVERVLRGLCSLDQLAVHHVLVSKSPTADQDAEKPRLNPTLFKRGRRCIVAMRFKSAPMLDQKFPKYAFIFADDHERMGPMAADPSRLNAVQKLLQGARSLGTRRRR